MPFLHGFRRIVYEYQPLVDAIMCVLGQGEGGGGGQGDGDGEEDRREDDSRVSVSLVELLDRESQSDVFHEGISYALFKVAGGGLVSAAQILLRYGASLNFEDPVSYYNPLHIAVLQNRADMVKLLVGHGADVEKRDRIHESSPLDLATEEAERLPCLQALLDLGADVNARDKYGKTPLLHALSSSDGLTVLNTDSIRLLLQRGTLHRGGGGRAAALLARAEALLDLAGVSRPGLCAPPRLDLPEPAQDSHPYAQALRDFHGRVAACRAAPPALQCLCRALIRSCLESRSLEDGVQALPLPDRLKDFVLAGRSCLPKPGWDCFKPQHSRR
ncbi:ankyrin repeat and SOCS box protein 6 [Cynoglossus semilaevis]|uniref:ankyrin repeat and SOCS box protein 6 n=1 Tax=Cynoglossus semilaevis TaxID=244447 RepID=UPI000D629207|nr:ankyrin repeat and SOCS box protein 6 [Cynoglossus semilaevis]